MRDFWWQNCAWWSIPYFTIMNLIVKCINSETILTYWQLFLHFFIQNTNFHLIRISCWCMNPLIIKDLNKFWLLLIRKSLHKLWYNFICSWIVNVLTLLLLWCNLIHDWLHSIWIGFSNIWKAQLRWCFTQLIDRRHPWVQIDFRKESNHGITSLTFNFRHYFKTRGMLTMIFACRNSAAPTTAVRANTNNWVRSLTPIIASCMAHVLFNSDKHGVRKWCVVVLLFRLFSFPFEVIYSSGLCETLVLPINSALRISCNFILWWVILNMHRFAVTGMTVIIVIDWCVGYSSSLSHDLFEYVSELSVLALIKSCRRVDFQLVSLLVLIHWEVFASLTVKSTRKFALQDNWI